MKRIGKVAAIAILALLIVAIALGVIAPLKNRPSCNPVALAQMQLASVGAACRAYLAEYGEPPGSLDDLVQNRKNIVFIEWGKSGTNDGWGNPIRFKPYDASLGSGSVISYGRDGRPGGKGRDADIEVRFGERTR